MTLVAIGGAVAIIAGAWLQAQTEASIVWANPAFVEFVQPNQKKLVTVSFRSNRVISGAEIRISPPLASVVSAPPKALPRINANQNTSLTLVLRGPTAAGVRLDGTIQLQSAGGNELITEPLHLSVVVHNEPVPPDPGLAGHTTLAGIDADSDGVRDDIQRYLISTYLSDSRLRAAIRQHAVATQALVTTTNDLVSLDQARRRANDCLEYIVGANQGRLLAADVTAEVLNTLERSRAYADAIQMNSGRVYRLTPEESLRDSCTRP